MLEQIRQEIKELAEKLQDARAQEHYPDWDEKNRLVCFKLAFRYATEAKIGCNYGRELGAQKYVDSINKLFISREHKAQFLYDEGLTG